MTEKWGSPARVVAEAELLGGDKYRVVRDEHDDYCTDYVSSSEEFGKRIYRQSLDTALAALAGAAREAEEARRERGEVGVLDALDLWARGEIGMTDEEFEAHRREAEGPGTY